jgi:hypothetical protein
VLQGRLGLNLEWDLVWEPACGEGHISGVLEEYARNAPLAEIAAATGLTRRAVQKRAKRLDLTSADRQRAAVAEANRRRGQQVEGGAA